MAAVPGLKMGAALAAQLGPAAAAAGRGGVREADVSATLKKIPVDLGGGRVTVRARAAAQTARGGARRVCWRLALPMALVRRCSGAKRAHAPPHAPLPPPRQLSLYDVMPSGCVSDLVRLLEEWARDQ